MPSAAPPDPIFTADGDFWSPSPIAAGPFGGLHGGAVSGLIVARLEAEARRNDAGVALSASVLLLRPAPMRALHVETRALRLGGRASAFEAVVSADGERVAQGAATFARSARVEAPLAAPGAPAHPENLPVWEDHPSRRWRGFFDALDIRDDNRGCKWGRLTRPLTLEPSPLADVFAVADCATAFDLSSRGMFPAPFRHPNIDIAIHVSRRPEGAWVGVAPYSDWRGEAVGLTEARLFDDLGVLGRSCQAIVIIPREK